MVGIRAACPLPETFLFVTFSLPGLDSSAPRPP
nr:MAG TPA: hypothetical protein [Caudoviricetes sp.]